MNTIRIIGDVHGLISKYQALTAGTDRSIQIGDLGLGFKGVNLESSPRHKFFRGNHDSPQACRDHPGYLGDFGYDAALGLFWFSGADSIDRHLRREGVSWWRDEELSVAQFEEALELYERVKPRVVLSHDGPQAFIEVGFGIRSRSRTRQALQAAYELWQPELWLFGHHHVRREYQSPEGTLFMCIPELGWVDVPLPLPLWGQEGPILGPWRTEVTEEQEFQEKLQSAAEAIQDALGIKGRRASLLARVCLQNSGKLSKTKRERHFAELTDGEVEKIEEAIRGAKQEPASMLRGRNKIMDNTDPST